MTREERLYGRAIIGGLRGDEAEALKAQKAKFDQLLAVLGTDPTAKWQLAGLVDDLLDQKKNLLERVGAFEQELRGKLVAGLDQSEVARENGKLNAALDDDLKAAVIKERDARVKKGMSKRAASEQLELELANRQFNFEGKLVRADISWERIRHL